MRNNRRNTRVGGRGRVGACEGDAEQILLKNYSSWRTHAGIEEKSEKEVAERSYFLLAITHLYVHSAAPFAERYLTEGTECNLQK